LNNASGFFLISHSLDGALFRIYQLLVRQLPSQKS